MPMTLLNSVSIDHPGNINRTLNLYVGDVTDMTGHNVDFLVVSALPGDYAPVRGSVLASLAAKGVNVQSLASNKAANYEPDLPCWISNPLSNPQSGIAFSRVLVYEPTNPTATSAQHVASIFAALAAFRRNTRTSVALTLVSAGSGKADPLLILRALFFAAVSWGSRSQVMLPTINIVLYPGNTQLNTQLQALFSSLKNSYSNVYDIPLAVYSRQAKTIADRFSPSSSLTRRQVFGIALFTTNYYRTVNAELRTSNITQPNYQALMPVLECIDSGLANLGGWAGPAKRGSSFYSSAYAEYQAGNTLLHLSYMSYSNGRPYAGALQIQTRSITGREVKKYSQFPAEDEVLFERNMQDRVTQAHWNAAHNAGTFETVQVVPRWNASGPTSTSLAAAPENGMYSGALNPEGFSMTLPPIGRDAVAQVLTQVPRVQALTTLVTPISAVLPDMERVIVVLDETGFIAPFDWNAEFENRLGDLTNSALLQNADLETLRKTITAHIRLDRYEEGYLDMVVKEGIWQTIMHRVQWLYLQGRV